MNNKVSVWLRSTDISQMSLVGGSIAWLGMVGDRGIGFIGSVEPGMYAGHLVTGAIGFGKVSNISVFSESMLGYSQIGRSG